MSSDLQKLLDFAESGVKAIAEFESMSEEQKKMALINFAQELLLMCNEALVRY